MMFRSSMLSILMSSLTTITAHLFAATTMNTEEKKSQNFPKKNLEYHNQGFRKKITTESLQAHLAWKRANWVLYCETFCIHNLGEMRLVENRNLWVNVLQSWQDDQ